MKSAHLQSQTNYSQNPKPYTKFEDNSLKVTQVLIHKRNCIQTDVRQTGERADTRTSNVKP